MSVAVGKTPSVAPPPGCSESGRPSGRPSRLRPGLISAIENWRLVTPGLKEIEPESGVYLPLENGEPSEVAKWTETVPWLPPSRTSVIVAVPASSSTVKFGRRELDRAGTGRAAGIDFDRGVPPASPLYFGSALVAGPVVTVAIAGDEPEPPAAVTVTVCGTSALAGVKVRRGRGQHGRGARGRDRQRHGDIGRRAPTGARP